MTLARHDVTVAGVRLACHVGGRDDAPPLVLLHALGESSASFDGVAGELGRHRRLIAVDHYVHDAEPAAFTAAVLAFLVR